MSDKVRLRYNFKCRMKEKAVQLERLSSAALTTVFLRPHQIRDSLENLQLAWNRRLLQARLSAEHSLSRPQLVSAAVPEPSAQRSLSWPPCFVSGPVRKFPALATQAVPAEFQGSPGQGAPSGPRLLSVFGLQGAHTGNFAQFARVHLIPGLGGRALVPLPPRCQTTAGNAASGICQEGPSATTLGAGVGGVGRAGREESL